jgi:signal transduction histidine kinase
VSVNDLCASVIALESAGAEAARVRIHTAFAGDLPPVEGDAEKLRQVLLNLVRNAIEAMPEGGTLTARTARHRDGVEIQIQDTGPGVPDEKSIFDAFFTTKPQGTGLGLSLVHRIVTDHGGQISVRSRPGETCFSIALPARVM